MNSIFQLSIFIRGFCMGIADIIPGISGGTIALITGIYHQFIQSLSRFDRQALDLLKHKKISQLIEYINVFFLLNVFAGILVAIISMSHLVHFLMDNYKVYTWSVFFGLIAASILYLIFELKNFKWHYLSWIVLGTLVGHFAVTLTPVDTPNNLWFIILSGVIAISAMILPGISGSFLLLILGKYAYITAALKNLFVWENIQIVAAFIMGAIISLFSFSKLLNYFLKKTPNQMMCVLIGFILGSLQKVWPWKEVTSSTVIRGKTKILAEKLIMPPEFNVEVILALTFMFLGFSLVIAILYYQKRGVSSAG